MDPRRRLCLITIAALTWAGCASNPVYLSKTFVHPQRVAVLPMSNETNDLDAAAYIRQLIFNRLNSRGIPLVPLAEVDAKLKVQGFTDGGQLRATTPQKLGEWIGADGLFYGTIEDFEYVNVGFLRSAKCQNSSASCECHHG